MSNPFTPGEQGEKVELEVPVLLPVHLIALVKLEETARRYLADYQTQGAQTLGSMDLVSKRFRKEATEILKRIDEKGGNPNGQSTDD